MSDGPIHFVWSYAGNLEEARPDAHVVVTQDRFTEGPCRFDNAPDPSEWFERRCDW